MKWIWTDCLMTKQCMKSEISKSFFSSDSHLLQNYWFEFTFFVLQTHCFQTSASKCIEISSSLKVSALDGDQLTFGHYQSSRLTPSTTLYGQSVSIVTGPFLLSLKAWKNMSIYDWNFKLIRRSLRRVPADNLSIRESAFTILKCLATSSPGSLSHLITSFILVYEKCYLGPNFSRAIHETATPFSFFDHPFWI